MSGKSYGMKYSLLPLLFDSIHEWGCLIVEGSLIYDISGSFKVCFLWLGGSSRSYFIGDNTNKRLKLCWAVVVCVRGW